MDVDNTTDAADVEAADLLDVVVPPPDKGEDAGMPPSEWFSCAPCTASEDCDGGTQCLAIDGYSFCLLPCEQGGAVCADGLACRDTGDGLFCTPPDDALCDCAEHHEGRSGQCANEGCDGAFACEDGALTACDAAAPKVEVCNGVDDDCDGAVDEDADATCDDGSICTTDSCGEAGCEYAPSLDGCLIGVNCFAKDFVSPVNQCMSCRPDIAPDAWSPLPDATLCSDGTACTADDACAAGTCVPGPVLECGESNQCTSVVCDPVQGCLVELFENKPCNDEDLCTLEDTCQAGNCVGVPKKCDDSLPCTLDECIEGVCDTSTLEPDTCHILNACYAGGATRTGVPCEACLPDDDATSWTVLGDEASCDDSNPCTENGACTAGECVSSLVDCDDGNPCTFNQCTITGCFSAPLNKLGCDDGDLCSVDDVCVLDTCLGTGVECDDGSACTEDSCDPASGCVFKPLSEGACDDGDACTENDVCDAGGCAGTTIDCGDAYDCTTDTCVEGACESQIDSGFCVIEAACVAEDSANPDNACQACLPQVDTSAYTDVAAGTACDDGTACTTGEQCQGGACLGGTPVICSDGNPCTDEVCDPADGCVFTNNDASCNDELFCTVGDVCAGGSCSGTPQDCSSLDSACSIGTCSEEDGACVAAPVADDTICDDANVCSAPDLCKGGACVGTPLSGCCALDLDCNDGNPCTADSCVVGTGTCVNDSGVLDGTTCDDGSACSTGDTCGGGECAGTPLVCVADECNTASCSESVGGCVVQADPDGAACAEDGQPCTSDFCKSGACVHPPNAAQCDDGVACTFNDRCADGVCAGTGYVCDDKLKCTDDFCDGKGFCIEVIHADACRIANACVDAGQGNPGNACEVCDPSKDQEAWSDLGDGAGCPDDGNVCTDDVCGAGACTHPPNANACDDGDLCTELDVCAAGACAGKAFKCDDTIACTDNVCDGVGGCSYPVTAGLCLIGGQCYADQQSAPSGFCQYCDVAAANTSWTHRATGTDCDDASACTQLDKCQSGTCIGAPIPCNDEKACTDDSCDPATGCVYTPNTNSCEDGDFCTVSDTCAGGACIGVPRDCISAADACNLGVCDEALDACVPSPKANSTPCDDGVTCTGPDTCTDGSCTGPVKIKCCTVDSDCDDGNGCTADSCDVGAETCVFNPVPLEGAGCDDGKFCTPTDTCTAGICTGPPRDCSLFGDECNDGVCNEAADACEQSPANEGAACPADANDCTDDVCQGGTCAHPNNTAACNDGDLCTFNDTCNAGSCGGTPNPCEDKLDCTVDACNGVGGCTFTPTAGTCAIGGVCYDKGDTNPGNQCQVCDPSSPGAWTNKANATPCSDGDPCTSGEACSGGACVGGSGTCDPCDSKLAGETCDDSDASTVGDICLKGKCAGFTIHQGYPSGAGVSPYLRHVMWTADAFHATGGDGETGNGRAWAASLGTDGSVNVIASTKKNGQRMVAIADRMVVTNKATFYRYTSGSWGAATTLTEKLKALPTNNGTAMAAWGLVDGDKYVYWIAGRNGDAWIAMCGVGTGSLSEDAISCSSQGTNFNLFPKETPRAMHGLGSLSGADAARAYLSSDEPAANGTHYNDVVSRQGVNGSLWWADFTDQSNNEMVGRDVFARATNNVWVGGSGGLLRARTSSWSGWTYVGGSLSDQYNQDVNGIWVDSEVVLLAVTDQQGGSNVALKLISHPMSTNHLSSSNWHEQIMLDPPAVQACSGGGCVDAKFQPARSGQLLDVWSKDGVVMMTGWTYDQSKGGTRP